MVLNYRGRETKKKHILIQLFAPARRRIIDFILGF